MELPRWPRACSGGHVGRGAEHVAVLGEPGGGGARVGRDVVVERHRLGREVDGDEAGEAVALVVDAAGQAPVHHQDLAELADHEVVGLEVAVHHAAAVGEGHGLADAGEGVEEAAERPPGGRLHEAVGPGRLVHLFDDGAQGAAAHLLHGEPEAGVGQHAVIVDGDDARVLELGGDPGLGEEAGAEVLGVDERGAEHLHRQGAVEDPVADAPHLAEAAGGDAAEVLVAVGEEAGERAPARGLPRVDRPARAQRCCCGRGGWRCWG